MPIYSTKGRHKCRRSLSSSFLTTGGTKDRFLSQQLGYVGAAAALKDGDLLRNAFQSAARVAVLLLETSALVLASSSACYSEYFLSIFSTAITIRFFLKKTHTFQPNHNTCLQTLTKCEPKKEKHLVPFISASTTERVVQRQKSVLRQRKKEKKKGNLY